jgi:hypothetical protein
MPSPHLYQTTVSSFIVICFICTFAVEGLAQTRPWSGSSERSLHSSPQSSWDRSSSASYSETQDPAGTRLPGWAEPRDSSPRPGDRATHADPISPSDDAVTNAPPPPGVPVDGGLVWLTLAGAGYATKKLYDGRKGEDRE